MSVTVKKPWTRQPQTPTPLDFSLFKSSEIAEIYCPSQGYLRGVFTGATLTAPTGAVTNVTGTGGKGLRVASGGNQASLTLAADADSILNTSDVTILYVRSFNTLAFTNVSDLGYVASATDRVNVHIPYLTTTDIYFDWGNDSTGRLTATVANDWVVGKAYNFALVAGSVAAKGREYWRDGIKVASSTATTARAATAQPFYIGNQNAGDSSDSKFYLVVVLKVALDDVRIKQWSANPWQIFAPQQRIIPVGAASAGGTVGLTGQAGTFAVGTLSPSISVVLTGNSGTFAAGTVIAGEGEALVGNSGSFAVGTLSPQITVGLTGNARTFAVGSLTPSISVGLTGNSGAFSVGVPTGLTSITSTATGNAGAFNIGALSVAMDVGLTGQAGTFAVGSLTPNTGSPDVTVYLTGNSGAFAIGSLIPDTGEYIPQGQGNWYRSKPKYRIKLVQKLSKELKEVINSKNVEKDIKKHTELIIYESLLYEQLKNEFDDTLKQVISAIEYRKTEELLNKIQNDIENKKKTLLLEEEEMMFAFMSLM